MYSKAEMNLVQSSSPRVAYNPASQHHHQRVEFELRRLEAGKWRLEVFPGRERCLAIYL
jgi:hypothetical protein